TGASRSLLIAGSRMLTAEVLALTTNADTHAAARTPPPALTSCVMAMAAIVTRTGMSTYRPYRMIRTHPWRPDTHAMAASTSHVSAQAGSRAEPELSGWIVFAALMLLVAGGFSLVYGLAAVLNDQVVTVGGQGVLVWDFTVWGWAHMVVGAIMLLTCWGLFA